MKRRIFAGSIVVVFCVAAAVRSDAETLPLTYEVRSPATGDPDAIKYVYVCPACTPANWESVELPDGFEKSPNRLRLMRDPRFTPVTPPKGVPETLDLSPTIPGDDMAYVGRVLSIEFVGFRLTSGVQIRARVERTATFSFRAGTVVHELTDPDGGTWVMISVPIEQTIHDPAGEGTIDPAELDAFAHVKGPWGWTASSRVLDEDFVLSSNPTAEIVGQMWGGVAWQRVTDDQPHPTSVPLEQAISHKGSVRNEESQ